MNLSELEKLFFDLAPEREPSPLFIVGSPRTGSTPLYQAVASAFSLPYISNFINRHFAHFPVVGFALQHGIRMDIDWRNEFGKTKGEFQLSEGSAVISNWFGGGHPSQLVSREFIEGRKIHFKNTLSTAESLYGKPVVIKNPWNCFRVEAISKELTKCRFIWIRRDIAAAAKSDLEARYITKGTPHSWNSATPANVQQLMQLEPFKQVVENQYEFHKALEDALSSYAQNRFLEVWHEDFVREPKRVLEVISTFIGCGITQTTDFKQYIVNKSSRLSKAESKAIEDYVKENSKFNSCRYEFAQNSLTKL